MTMQRISHPEPVKAVYANPLTPEGYSDPGVPLTAGKPAALTFDLSSFVPSGYRCILSTIQVSWTSSHDNLGINVEQASQTGPKPSVSVSCMKSGNAVFSVIMLCVPA